MTPTQKIEAPVTAPLVSDLAFAAAAIEAQGMPPAASASAQPGEGAAASPGAAAAGPSGPDYDGDARDLVGFLRDGLVPVYPRLDLVYTPEACERLSYRLGRVMAKYHWSLEFFGEEIALALVTFPIAVATFKIIREDLKADKAQQARRPAAAPGPGPLPSDSSTEPLPAQPAVPVNADAIKRVQNDNGANLFKKT